MSATDATGFRPRDAVWGLAGTIVGAVLGLAGTFTILQQEADLDSKVTKRSAFATFLAEAEEYRGHLRLLREAAQTGDQATYDTERTTTQNAGGELYAAAAVVRIVAEDATGRAAAKVNDLLFAVDKPELVVDYDLATVTAQVDAVSPALSDFLDLARAEVGGQ